MCERNKDLCGCLAVHPINYAEHAVIEGAQKCAFHFREIRRLCCIVLLELGSQVSVYYVRLEHNETKASKAERCRVLGWECVFSDAVSS